MAIYIPAEWAKANKKEFANKLIKKSRVVPKERSSAIFMAGLPGAGKTEFTKRLIENSVLTVVRIDMDEIASQIKTYTPDKADKYRVAATTLLNEVHTVGVWHENILPRDIDLLVNIMYNEDELRAYIQNE